MREDNLFQEDYIGSHLSALERSLSNYIKDLDLKKIMATEENVLLQEIVERFKLNPPKLFEDKIQINPQETEISLGQNHSSRWMLDDDDFEPRPVKGLHIEIRIPFEGDGSLFKYRPSSFSYSLSGTTPTQIQGNYLVMEYDTTEKDPEKIKNLWGNDLVNIRKNLEILGTDVKPYNGGLEAKIRSQVASRKKEAESNQSLIDALKR